MALVQGSDITTEAIIEGFQSAVVNNILSGAYHAGNAPMYRGYQCVPTSIMDHLSNVNKVPNVGQEGDIVNADQVLRGLISLTRNLTRVGTFAFTLYLENSEGGTRPDGTTLSTRTWYTTEGTMSGRCIFTQSKVRTGFGAPSNTANVAYGQTIKVSNLNQLFANIYQQWSNTDRYQHVSSDKICHSSCHENCHYNCHYSCHSSCHGWTIIRNA